MYDTETIAKAVKSVIENINTDGQIKIGVSQRHIHLSQEDLETLFGKGYKLTVKKYLMGREFASNEVVTLVGPSLKAIENVRVLGPVRNKTQVEISRTDTFVLKVSPPVR
ncbi:MAG: phosphate propanoyltransferase, partial [Clostridia bacterium]|nr:phosphate propanoyltransferase [Clostridia bacterium]